MSYPQICRADPPPAAPRRIIACMSYPPPRYDLFPKSLQSALILRGALRRCGPGVRGVAWPDTPTVRLAALAQYLHSERIACHLTAAWVWHALPDAPEPYCVATSPGRGHATTLPGTRIMQFSFREDEVAKLGHFLVTSPQRTLYDLLHQPHSLSELEREAARVLLGKLSDRGAALRAQLHNERRPYGKRASTRLATIMKTSSHSLL